MPAPGPSAKAFGAHGAWNTRIAQAIECGHSEHKPDDVAADDRCAFGKWLHDPSLAASIRGSDEYRTVVRLHADFHRAAGATLAKALTGDRAGAQADLAEGRFVRAAAALSGAMVRWRRNAATACAGYGGLRSFCLFWKGRIALRIWVAIAIPALAALATVAFFDLNWSPPRRLPPAWSGPVTCWPRPPRPCTNCSASAACPSPPPPRGTPPSRPSGRSRRR
ncbi:MAG: CZB domain-containing protein [Solirubrobacterales bacterium]